MPPDDEARDPVRSRGGHLDEDVPSVTTIVQRAEHAADAADAHMSVTSAEFWTLAKPAIELFGASVSKFANKFTSYSIDSDSKT